VNLFLIDSKQYVLVPFKIKYEIKKIEQQQKKKKNFLTIATPIPCAYNERALPRYLTG